MAVNEIPRARQHRVLVVEVSLILPCSSRGAWDPKYPVPDIAPNNQFVPRPRNQVPVPPPAGAHGGAADARTGAADARTGAVKRAAPSSSPEPGAFFVAAARRTPLEAAHVDKRRPRPASEVAGQDAAAGATAAPPPPAAQQEQLSVAAASVAAARDELEEDMLASAPCASPVFSSPGAEVPMSPAAPDRDAALEEQQAAQPHDVPVVLSPLRAMPGLPDLGARAADDPHALRAGAGYDPVARRADAEPVRGAPDPRRADGRRDDGSQNQVEQLLSLIHI